MENLKNNIPEYSVSEFNSLIKETISSAFDMIKIRGEISNLKKPSSGHIYFTLKDEDSVINAVFFKNNVINSNFKIEEGMEVVGIGKISTFAKSISTYQIIVSNIENLKYPEGIACASVLKAGQEDGDSRDAFSIIQGTIIGALFKILILPDFPEAIIPVSCSPIPSILKHKAFLKPLG